MLFDIPVLF